MFKTPEEIAQEEKERLEQLEVYLFLEILSSVFFLQLPISIFVKAFIAPSFRSVLCYLNLFDDL